MEKFVIALKTLLVIALLALPILLLADVITTIFLSRLAWISIAFGLIVYILGAIVVGHLEKNGCDECGALGDVFVIPALCLTLPAICLLLILWFFEDVFKWVYDPTTIQIASWIIIALFIIGIIQSLLFMVMTLVKRRKL